MWFLLVWSGPGGITTDVLAAFMEGPQFNNPYCCMISWPQRDKCPINAGHFGAGQAGETPCWVGGIAGDRLVRRWPPNHNTRADIRNKIKPDPRVKASRQRQNAARTFAEKD